MGSEREKKKHQAWKPHPDDEADVRDAIAAAERGELLSVEASEAFLQWLEGGGNESRRDARIAERVARVREGQAETLSLDEVEETIRRDLDF
jgi:hypothetical protein